MADAAVSFLLLKLDDFATREWKLDNNIRKKVSELELELKSIEASLKDADARKDHDNLFKAWIQNVRDQAYGIEHVLDLFRLGQAESVMQRRKIQYSISNLIEDVDTRLERIKTIKESYTSLSSISTTTGNNTYLHVRAAPLYSGGHGILGIEEPRNQLVSWALQPAKREVIFVVGMAGSGKTTLIHSVYEKVKDQFDWCTWITASKSKTEREILNTILWEFCCSMTNGADLNVLKHKVRDCLHKKRYVVVLDDLWVKGTWESIKQALPDNDNSRVIITTRRGDIAHSCRHDNSISIHNLQPLPFEAAEQLFFTTTLSGNGKCPPGLEEVSKSILQICDGLPLGIIEIGKLLSSKDKTAYLWQKLLDSLESELGSNGALSDMMKVLSASYNDLPYHLKYCFLYLSMFPENNPVKRRRLIRLWIAEGFVPVKQGKTLEEVGEEFLHELIDRSLVKAKEMDFDGRPAIVGVHSLMHKMILLVSHEENFSTVCTGPEGDLTEKTQRLSIQKEDFDLCKDLPHVRTFISFSTGRVKVGSSFKLLKVLDIQDTSFGQFPTVITDLLLLRYLSLRNTDIKSIPKSLRKLLLLETLDLKQTQVTKLPKAVLQLHKLRHLLVYRYNMGTTAFSDDVQGFNVPEKIGKLKSLERLSFVKANRQKFSFVKANRQSRMIQELGNLTELRKLGIVELAKEDGISLCQSIQKMPNLHSLTLTSLNKEEVLELDAMTNPPRRLQRLHLVGPLERFPIWVSSLNDLMRIRLKWSSLTKDKPIAALEDLKNLVEIQLIDAYIGTQLEFNTAKFRKLKTIHLEQLKQLKFILMEEGTLPCLQKLIIKNCSELEPALLGIEKRSHLQELLLYDMPERFVSQLRKNDGILRERVHHIPRIHSYKLGRLAEDLS